MIIDTEYSNFKKNTCDGDKVSLGANIIFIWVFVEYF